MTLSLTISIFLHAQTTLPTAWNFSSPGITTPPTGWTLLNNLPASTGGQTYAFGIGDALACRFDAAGEYLTINFTDKPGTMTYYVSPQNAGNTWTGLFEVQQSTDGSNWSTLKSFTTWPNTVTNFTNGKQTETGLSASTRWVRFIFTTKTSGNFALDSVRIQAAPITTASINLKQSGKNVVMGSEFVVGNISNTNFTIENKGSVQTLYVTGITFTGPAASDFSYGSKPDSILANSSGNFNLIFNPGSNTGTRKATMHIATNDTDKPDYLVNLYAIGGSYATEPDNGPASVSIKNVTACGMDVTWTAPLTGCEHYLVTQRKAFVPLGAPVDGFTYTKGNYIGSSQVVYIGDSISVLHPTFIHANTDYTFTVYAFNGPAGHQNYKSVATYAAVHTPGPNIGSYYNGINRFDNTLINKLTTKINPHDTIFYSQYISRFVEPFLTRDTSDAKKVVNCVYTSLPQIYTEPFQWWNGTNASTLTREHTYPQSWMPSRSAPNWPNAANGKEFPEYNDMHHLFPADQANGNGVRSNYPFGEVVSNPQPSPSGMGILGKDANGATVYEPRNEHKGDAARAVFYMCTAYNGINGLNWSLPSSQDQAVLKKWHFQDLPDNWEIARHEFVFGQQHNRNPFIDSPNFACHIDFSNMSYIANPGPCGIVIPPPASLTITKPVGGEFIWWGSTDTVKWLSSGVDSIEIQLWMDDTLYQSYGVFPAAPGFALWTLPYVMANHCKVLLKDTKSSLVSMSNLYFIILGEGLNEYALSQYISCFPNPSSGQVTISASSGIHINQVSVLDITGKILFTTAQPNFKIEEAGCYFISIKTDQGMLMKKMIIE